MNITYKHTFFFFRNLNSLSLFETLGNMLLINAMVLFHLSLQFAAKPEL